MLTFPPHITFAQAKSITSALLKRDPDSLNVIRRSFREKIQQVIPRR